MLCSAARLSQDSLLISKAFREDLRDKYMSGLCQDIPCKTKNSRTLGATQEYNSFSSVANITHGSARVQDLSPVAPVLHDS